MDLSIITVNYRCWEHLRAALGGLLDAPEFTAGQWQMIVVDNASDDGRLTEFRESFPQVRFLENDGNHGFASGNNLGARAARGRELLFMNPDIRADAGAIRNLLTEKSAHRDIRILTAPQTDARMNLQKSFDRFPDLLTYFRSVRGLMRWLAPARNPDARRVHASIVDCDWVSGSLLMIGRDDFDQLGGWSEDYWMYAEDMDLCRRAANLGMRRAMTPAARFVHLHGGASRRNAEVTLLTKTEVLISAHVYIWRHFTGIHRVANHTLVALRNVLPLSLATVLNVITFGRLPGIRLRAQQLARLLSYYRGVLRTGTWLSPRSFNYPTTA